MKLLLVTGARPNFIKVAPLFRELKKHKSIRTVLVHTGQHYDFEMSEVFFKNLNIPKPDYNLNIGSASHAVQTAQAMVELEKVFLKEKPSVVVIIGDVNSTLAAAITAAKLRIPVAHIEAGPRTYDKAMPEEYNRVLCDHVSDFLFCPTKSSVENLRREGISKGVYFTGDTMYDAFLSLLPAVKAKEKKILAALRLAPKSYILLTAHRAANVDDTGCLTDILEAVIESGETVVFPVHPRTKKRLASIMGQLKKLPNFNNIIFTAPLPYTETLALEKNAKKICTDSGGIQKEAYWLGVPCITMLSTRGWVETFESGWNILVSVDKKKICYAIKYFSPRGRRRRYFGNGDSAYKIVRVLINFKELQGKICHKAAYIYQ